MFLTRPSFAEWFPPFEGYEDCRTWGAIELSAALPWFMVEVQGASGSKDSFNVTYLVTRLDTIKGLIDNFGTGDRVSSVLAFYPPAFTQHHTWLVKEIEELWQGSFSVEESSCSVWMLKTPSGEVMIEPPLDCALEDVSPETLVYRRDA